MKLPYGQSNFKTVAEDCYYVDRTMYIEYLEGQNNPYQFYLRPRKFGKSLFVSMLEHYYGQQHMAGFQQHFGRFYIGQQPTPLANQYLVLVFDFSAVATDSPQHVQKSFSLVVKTGLEQFFNDYGGEAVKESHRSLIEQEELPADILQRGFNLARQILPGQKIFILIDEYDHFTNELIAFYLEDFKDIVSRNGFVRKFFEAIKKETRSGLVERLFATGVSPVTLDSLTSGFNIAEKLSEDLALHDMMGFTEAETMDMLRFAGVADEDLPRIIRDLRSWYNGYCFNPDAPHKLYNPEMVIYFANHYGKYQTYPEELLDENVASDYNKLQRMLQVGGAELGLSTMETVMAQGWVRARLTKQFTFERPWLPGDQVSLLHYLGMLTVKERTGAFWAFQIPNLAIKGLYYSFFLDQLRQRADLKGDLYADLSNAVHVLSMDNELKPFLQVVERVLSRLSGRDVQRFDESHLHIIFAALLNSAQAWLVQSQPEMERRFVDILCTRLPSIPVNWDFAFELKYLKQKDAAQLPAKAEEAKTQLEGYLQTEDLQRVEKLAAYAIVFVGAEAKSVARVR